MKCLAETCNVTGTSAVAAAAKQRQREDTGAAERRGSLNAALLMIVAAFSLCTARLL